MVDIVYSATKKNIRNMKKNQDFLISVLNSQKPFERYIFWT